MHNTRKVPKRSLNRLQFSLLTILKIASNKLNTYTYSCLVGVFPDHTYPYCTNLFYNYYRLLLKIIITCVYTALIIIII